MMMMFSLLLVLLPLVRGFQHEPRRLSRLLLQRAIQTQIVYMTYLNDEAKAHWLGGFKEPGYTLLAERLTDGDCRPSYNGLDAFADELEAGDYLAQMLTDDPFKITVAYRMDGGGSSAPKDATPGLWEVAGSSSQRNNPYLQQKPKFLEYEETVVPQRLAMLLMQTREQLAAEWSSDLGRIAELNDDLVTNPFAALSKYAVSTTDDDSPLRAESLDLCERLVTREAAIATAKEVCPSAARWILSKLEPDALMDAQRDALLLGRDPSAKLDTLGEHTHMAGLATEWLLKIASEQPFETASGRVVDTRSIVGRIKAKRDTLAREWAGTIVEEVQTEHTDSHRDCLEKSLLIP